MAGLVDQDLKVVIEILADVASQLRRDNPCVLGVATDSEVHGAPRIKNSYFGFFRRCLAFTWFALAKIAHGLCSLPERIVQSSIQPRRTFNAYSFRHPRSLLRQFLNYIGNGKRSGP